MRHSCLLVLKPRVEAKHFRQNGGYACLAAGINPALGISFISLPPSLRPVPREKTAVTACKKHQIFPLQLFPAFAYSRRENSGPLDLTLYITVSAGRTAENEVIVGRTANTLKLRTLRFT